MKKFLIAVICIIPVIVVLALSVTGNLILSATSPNPSDMVIKDSTNQELEDGALVEVDINETEEFLIIEILPSFVRDKEVVCEDSSEEGMTGEVELVKREGSQDRYSIVPVRAGVTKLTVRAASARDVYRTLTFNVTTKEIDRFEIYTDMGESTETPIAYFTKTETFYSGEVKLYGAERFYTAAEPHSAYAALESDVTWQSSDDEIATVDPTGLVTPLRRTDERVQITATTYDGSGKQFSASFTVDLSEAVVSSTTVYVSDAFLFGAGAREISAWLNEKIVLARGAEITEKTVSDAAGSVRAFDISYGGNVISVEVVFSATAWGFGSMEKTLYSGNGNQSFTVIDYLSGEEIEEGVTAVSDNPEVLRADADNRHLIPLKAGKATITLYKDGESSAMSFTVMERPVAFDLDLQKTDGERGIARDRYWGNYWLDTDGNLTKTIYFGIKNDSNAFELRWFVNTGAGGEALAELTPAYDGTQSVYVTFLDAAVGQNVILTAKLYMQGRIVNSMQRSFTFVMLEKQNSVNVYTASDFGAVYDRYPTYDYAMQSDIRADRIFSNMSGSIYGNGFLYDAAGVVVPDDGDSAIRYRWEDLYNKLRNEFFGGATPSKQEMTDFLKEKGLDELTVYNLKMRGAETLEAAENTYSVLGYALGYYNEPAMDVNIPRDPPMAIRFCEIYNSERGIQIERVNDVLIEGCILGDNAKHSIFSFNHLDPLRRYPEYFYTFDASGNVVSKTSNTYTDDRRPGYNLTFRNNVFKMSSGPAAVFSGTSIPGGYNYYWGDYSVAPDLNIEGSLKIYNWMTKDEFYNCVKNLITYYLVLLAGKDYEGLVNTLLGNYLETVVSEFLGIAENDNLYYSYGGDRYIGLGMFGLGCIYGWDFDAVNVSEESVPDVEIVKMMMTYADGSLPKNLQAIENLVTTLSIQGFNKVSNTCMILCNNFSTGQSDIEPGDPVPANDKLYDQLTASKNLAMPWA